MNTAERDLLLRAFDESLSAAEQSRLDNLLGTNAEARGLKRDEMAMREIIARTKVMRFGDGFAQRVMTTIDRDAPTNHLTRVSVLWKYRVRVAAVLAILAASITALLLVGPQSQSMMRSAANGTSMEFLLPDGSTAVLNAGSTISYPREFNNTRVVELVGEAYFSVARDVASFTVNTADASIIVHGTEFNVRAWSEIEQRTIVTLDEGSVSVTDRTQNSVVMNPGERTTVSSTGGIQTSITPSRTDPSLSSAMWITGGLEFHDEPASFVMAELERKFNVQIRFEPLLLDGRRVTYLSTKPGDVETVLTAVCHALSLRFRNTVSGFEIRSFDA